VQPFPVKKATKGPNFHCTLPINIYGISMAIAYRLLIFAKAPKAEPAARTSEIGEIRVYTADMTQGVAPSWILQNFATARPICRAAVEQFLLVDPKAVAQVSVRGALAPGRTVAIEPCGSALVAIENDIIVERPVELAVGMATHGTPNGRGHDTGKLCGSGK
jgi:hypothetical protein